MYAAVNILPTKLLPIDNPIKTPLLKSPKLVVSFPLKNMYTSYNKLPKIIDNIPDFNLFIILSPFYYSNFIN